MAGRYRTGKLISVHIIIGLSTGPLQGLHQSQVIRELKDIAVLSAEDIQEAESQSLLEHQEIRSNNVEKLFRQGLERQNRWSLE